MELEPGLSAGGSPPDLRAPPAAPIVIPASPAEVLLVFQYDGTGLRYCDMWENQLLGWVVDGANPDFPAEPRVVGSIPAPPATGRVLSPPWASLVGLTNPVLFVPDLWHGTSLTILFTWLATNNGANRALRGNFVTEVLRGAWSQWSQQHPDLVFAGPPPAPW